MPEEKKTAYDKGTENFWRAIYGQPKTELDIQIKDEKKENAAEIQKENEDIKRILSKVNEML